MTRKHKKDLCLRMEFGRSVPPEIIAKLRDAVRDNIGSVGAGGLFGWRADEMTIVGRIRSVYLYVALQKDSMELGRFTAFVEGWLAGRNITPGPKFTYVGRD